jgi:hypothetical protein
MKENVKNEEMEVREWNGDEAGELRRGYFSKMPSTMCLHLQLCELAAITNNPPNHID